MHPVIILTALPDKAAADKLASGLVESRLAACVNIIPLIESVYFWQNEIVRDQEYKMLIKTSSAVHQAAIEFIKKNHPYTVPEITVIGTKGDVTMHDDYWSWLSNYVAPSR